MSWPYEEYEDDAPETAGPTWQCPEETCQCHAPDAEGELHSFSVMLLAHDGARMPGGRCRILHRGRVLNKDQPNADGEGWITAKLPHLPATVTVEWAPASTPKIPGYPYRARYYVDLGEEREEAGRRRLHNLGYSALRSLRDNVERFQRDYGYEPVTGELPDIEADLTRYHDDGCPPITSAHASRALKAKEDAAPDAKTASPQPPASPAPGDKQGSVKAQRAIEIIVDWSRRPRTPPRPEQRSSGFWLEPESPPVTATVLGARDGWESAGGVAAKVEPEGKSKTSCVVRVEVDPDRPPRLLRLDFKLDVTIKKNEVRHDPVKKRDVTAARLHTRTVLALKQLYSIDDDGRLTPELFSFEDYAFEKGKGQSPPARVAGSSPGGRRTEDGLHPLLWHGPPLEASKGGPRKIFRRVFVNAEMVDVTELWWAVHPEESRVFYLHPGLGSRAEHLRVLAWTGGGLPMIWFAVLPDAAVSKLGEKGADVVYFRPPPGINSFEYSPTQAGFVDARHETTTMQMLSRCLLRAQPYAVLAAAGVDDDVTLRAFSAQIQPVIERGFKIEEPEKSLPPELQKTPPKQVETPPGSLGSHGPRVKGGRC